MAAPYPVLLCAWMDNDGPHGIAFRGLRVDDAVDTACFSVRALRRCNRDRQGSRRTAGWIPLIQRRLASLATDLKTVSGLQPMHG